jgi:hypothetical protein
MTEQALLLGGLGGMLVVVVVVVVGNMLIVDMLVEVEGVVVDREEVLNKVACC